MRLVLRRQLTTKPLGKARRGEQECKLYVETADRHEHLSKYLDVPAVTRAAQALGYRVMAAGNMLVIEMPFDVYSKNPPAVFTHMSQIVLDYAGPHENGPLGFVDEPLDYPRHEEPTADQMGLKATYVTYSYHWEISVDGWNGNLSRVILLQDARDALRSAGCEVDWGNDYALITQVPNQYFRTGSAELIGQGQQLVGIVQPFLRVRPGGALTPTIQA